MPSISVRKIDEDTIRLLRLQASEHGVSMEEEVRRILKNAVSTPMCLGDFAAQLFASDCEGDDFQIPDRETHGPISF